jgi:hypothetical protein
MGFPFFEQILDNDNNNIFNKLNVKPADSHRLSPCPQSLYRVWML